MQYEAMKTQTTLLEPTETGWSVMHKKYKNPYGTVLCSVNGKAARVATEFGDHAAQREEAVQAVLRAVFENTAVEEITVDGAITSREAWQAARHARYAALHRTREDYVNILGKPVHCVMDRPLGSAHPRYPEMLYPVNYGYVPGVIAGDNAEQDVYVLGPTVPLESFDGVVIAVIHRFDDCEDKWVAAEKTGLYTEEEIRAIVHFQEKYYTSEIIM